MKSLTAPAGEIDWGAARIGPIHNGDTRPIYVKVRAQTWMIAREQAMIALRCGPADLIVEPIQSS